jgi:hypothetical protein
MNLPVIKYIHWNAEEAAENAERMKGMGFEVDHELPQGTAFLGELAEQKPSAVVIDLSRLPSQGRDFGLLIRRRKSTRHIPLVFLGGAPEKVARVQEVLPDAAYASWDTVAEVLRDVLSNPPEDVMVPDSAFAGYAGKPLVEKLGIKPGMIVGLIDAPDDFENTLGILPEDVKLHDPDTGSCDLLMWFTRSTQELQAGIEEIAAREDYRSVWIAWPKKGSKLKSDLTQQTVRQTGLDARLVDYKICSIDKTWSGLLFTHRKKE